jgi:hypothetical protein
MVPYFLSLPYIHMVPYFLSLPYIHGPLLPLPTLHTYGPLLPLPTLHTWSFTFSPYLTYMVPYFLHMVLITTLLVSPSEITQAPV